MVESWKDKVDKLQQAIKDNPDLGVQVVYRSRQGLNDDPVCVPVLVSEPMKDDQYPDVVTAPPASMVNPKYNWFGADRGWYENDSAAQGTRITALENGAKNMTQAVAELREQHQQAVQNSKATDKKIDQVVQLVTVTNANIGQIMAALKAKPSKSSESQSEESTQPSQPTNTANEGSTK